MAPTGKLGQVVVVHRKQHHGGHEEEQHNGAWKIAYADFTTMMMAFFMMMWLVNITTPEQKEGIADYFNPINISSSNSGADGQLAGRSVADYEGALTSSAASAWETIPTARVPALAQPGPENVIMEGTPGPGKAQPIGEASDAKGDLSLGEVASGSIPAGPLMEPGLADRLALIAAEQASFERIEAEVRTAMALAGDLSGLKDNLMFEIVPEGLRIQLTDRPHFSMFNVGSIDLAPRAADLLRVVGEALVPVPNRIAVAGHTDGLSFAATARYGNWELSSDRANAARRILSAAGIPSSRLARVEGLADTVHLLPDAPADPRNRRISITVLRQVALPMGPTP
ncbi:flagellar motor protein MotB [Niveispirillum irakense]|uniref:flagellar motor protein MotB n=1 Tax=Niveispirillum irakense TaxID=34011 RepID=UPI00054DB83C|nr:flagellar motor protein MotB [Niveispirillum irakense]